MYGFGFCTFHVVDVFFNDNRVVRHRACLPAHQTYLSALGPYMLLSVLTFINSLSPTTARELERSLTTAEWQGDQTWFPGDRPPDTEAPEPGGPCPQGLPYGHPPSLSASPIMVTRVIHGHGQQRVSLERRCGTRSREPADFG